MGPHFLWNPTKSDSEKQRAETAEARRCWSEAATLPRRGRPACGSQPASRGRPDTRLAAVPCPSSVCGKGRGCAQLRVAAGCVREHPRLCPRPSRPRPRQHPKARAAGGSWGPQQDRCAHPGGRRGLAWTRSPQVEQGEEEPVASPLQGLPLWSLLAASWFFHSANSPRPVKRQALYHWSWRRTPAAVCRPCGSHKGQPHEGAAVGPQLPSVGRVV